ncbi:hypothetical protein [Cyclobacterium jeungdonense]|uniref:TMhelix containing protein n=1 Tax=Cyclobacterium jeungdonense TaxID=708087 RepID=A0ABT8C4D9_9BACT|nr:hypothetical protein [Cyclobacterium jeungdonense]MDN3687171.1 hypothetical protein [Cyclobacterium jeungdonense]
MKKLIIKLLSFIGLGLNIVPAILVFSAEMNPDTCKQLMLFGTILWFVTAPSWMNNGQEDASQE